MEILYLYLSAEKETRESSYKVVEEILQSINDMSMKDGKTDSKKKSTSTEITLLKASLMNLASKV